MNQCEETEEGVHPSETPLCGQHDNQTKAQRLDSDGFLSSDSEKDVAPSDDDSDQSSCSRISLGSQASSEFSCVSNQSKRSIDNYTDFKTNKKQKMSPLTTQELGVGSSAGMETMSTYPPMADPTSLPTTMWHQAIRKEKIEMLRGNQDLLRTSMKKQEKTGPPTTQELGVGSSSEMETMSTYPATAVPTSLPTTICRPHPLPPSLFMKWILAMNECEETEEGVHPSETPLCGQHDNQTKAQSSVKQQKPDSLVVSGQKHRVKSSDPMKPDFSESLFSHLLKKVATADGDSFWSSDSWLDSLESLSSYLKKDSFRSSDSRCVSLKERTRSYQHNIDFKKNQAFRTASAPMRPDFSESPFSHLLKKDATADRVSVLSSDSWLDSLESLSSDLKKDSFRSTDRRCVSRKERTRSYQHDIDFKKKRPDFRDSSSSDSKKDAAADRYSVLSSDSWEKEKTAPPTTQELVVGSSSEIETKSTHLPEAV